ncbi:ABC transporter ATP-binding protein [Bifidobacterium thermophilum RBL67]|uniref:ABC transporter ATP-binding protein n=3 Tax=Bifidobacterium thermophilum TaxID=33905 RepID=M4RG03_9BIFI|nr:ABC transporter ATP-binding protein [Bifidobacterium thermophilum RBL67]
MAWLASPPTAKTDASDAPTASAAPAVPDTSVALAPPALQPKRHNGTHPASERPMIEVRNLRKEYVMGTERVIALDRINLDIARGQICCIYGESGSGKSTLLNQLAGMERPTRGGVRIGGIVVSRLDERELAEFRQKHIGFVFQSYNLLPGLNAVENVAMPLMFRGVPREEREARARAMLRRVGLGKRLNHYPSQMSGGQQQRVGIARAFVTRPQVVFADEPTGNLDSKTKVDIMDMIRDFARENGQTIVLVTHDDHMAAYADRIVTLLDGRIVHDTEQDR